ncbi:hypothetical protein J4460_00035 [Candidatus Woesearchaeota archaeon]|nr:hypothetical protein [Candidatus Woesearchaeota archaeon]HIH37772.1 hypothetical protein [Candidatus Woesearchaeota archaeon]HIH49545.1 hypothetical protein [Candidatus Woesearchaeota archaeon]HIJ03897.1 hypothetical protein [Candidatus Woesearchaeota archaeon]
METIYVPDIECDSCVNLLKKRFEKRGIHDYQISKDAVVLTTDKINPKEVVEIIKEAGFRASTTPFERKSFRERRRDMKENPQKYELELQGLNYAGMSAMVLAILILVSYLLFFNTIPNFAIQYGWWVFYLGVSVITIGIALWHYFAYDAKYTCMVGMMVGMTFGMQAGMMVGAIIGATNGFFVGSMTGMLLGVFIGALTGKCCGIMGLMEGMMAGLMGGTMGPMISVMMFSDHLLWFMPFYMIINILIVAGLSYMLYEEVAEGNTKIKKKPIDLPTFASYCIIAAFILIAIMVFGPKSVLVGG